MLVIFLLEKCTEQFSVIMVERKGFGMGSRLDGQRCSSQRKHDAWDQRLLGKGRAVIAELCHLVPLYRL